MTTGTVESWNEDEGWGLLVSPDLPSPVWAHFSHIEMPGFRTLKPGVTVEFDYETAEQDGYRYRATRVLPPV